MLPVGQIFAKGLAANETKNRRTDKPSRSEFGDQRMKKLLSMPVIISLTLILMFSVGARGQQQTAKLQAAPVTTVTVDGSEAMFTTMCALLASGYEADVN